MSDSFQWRKRPIYVTYAAAALSVAAALFIARLMQVKYDFQPLTPFLCAIMFSAWLGGLRPGLFAMALSLLAFHSYLLAHLYDSSIEKELPRLLLGASTALFIMSLTTAQRSAAEKLRVSEQRYLSLFENMTEAVVYLRMLFDRGQAVDAIYLEVNPAWKNLTGLGNPVGRKLSEVVPGIRKGFFERTGRVATTGRPERFETYSAPLQKWLLVSAYCPRKEHVIVVLADITERKLAEDRLRLVIDTIPTMAWSLLPGGKIEYVNRRWLEYAGLSLQEALEKSVGMVHPEDLPRVLEKWGADRAAGNPSEDEMRLRRADGEYRWFLVRTVPLKDERGNIVKWYGTSTDIEDRKRADEALRKSEFDLAEAQRVARIGSWTIDVATDTVRGSEEYYRIYEIDKTTFEGKSETFWSMVHPDDYSRVAQTAADAVSSGQPYELEYRIVTRSGKQKHIRRIGYARKDSSGAVSVRFGTAQDITDEKCAEIALRDAASQMQALSRRLVELQEAERKDLSRELHDRVGQTLTALSINLAILRQGHPDAEARSRLEDSAALVESSMQSIENVLADLRPQMLDDHGLRAALEWYARQYSARAGMAVSVRATKPDERLAAEVEIALFRIAQEGLNNVAKHAHASNVVIALDCRGSECVMSVTDDGVGLRAADEKADGTRPCLGMVTMRERAQAVGGEISIESLPEGGTRLTARIPT